MSGFTLRRIAAALLLIALGSAGWAWWRARTPPNLLVITLDTVRADHLGCYGGAIAATPTLDRLAQDGVRFEHAYSPVPLTLPAHASLMTGLQPLAHGLTDNGMRAASFPVATLAERLRAADYDTSAFVAAFVLNSVHGLDRGFDLYDDGPDDAGSVFSMFRGSGAANERIDRLLDWLRRPRTKPFFAWLHLFDAHAPYLPPEGFAKRYAAQPYAGEIAYIDSQLARVVAFLERQGWAENTLVVVTADHGESLGEHGELTHGIYLYDATLRVPLLMRWTGHLPARTDPRSATLVDVLPTILGLLDLPPPELRHGVDLFADPADGPAWRHFAYSDHPRRQYGWAPLAALRSGSLKYIEAPHAELYDLGKDPKETTNLISENATEATRLGDALSVAISELGALATPAAVDTQMTPELRQRLQSLGYLAAHESERTADTAVIDPKDGMRSLGPKDAAFDALARMDLAHAETLYRQALEATPRSLTVRDGLARTLELAGRETEAEALHESILANNPEAMLSLARLIEMRTRRGDCAAARPAAAQLARLLPNAAEIDVRMARCATAAVEPPAQTN